MVRKKIIGRMLKEGKLLGIVVVLVLGVASLLDRGEVKFRNES